MQRSLLHDHPPLALAVAGHGQPLGLDLSAMGTGVAITLVLLAIVAILLLAGVFGKYASAVWAYLAFGLAHYALQAAAAIYPSTAHMYFLPVAFVVTGVLGSIVSYFADPQFCAIPFESNGQSSSVAEWREWRSRIGREAGSTSKGSSPVGSAIEKNSGVLLGMLSSACMCLSQLFILTGFTYERRGLGAFQGLLMLNVAIFVIFFAGWGEAVQSGEKQGLVLWLVGLVLVSLGTAHTGTTSMASLGAVCIGAWVVCFRFSLSVGTSGTARFATMAALGAAWVVARNGLPEWDTKFALLVSLTAAGTVGGCHGTAAAFAQCRPVAAVIILGSFSTLTFVIQLCLEQRLPTITLALGILVVGAGAIRVCKA